MRSLGFSIYPMYGELEEIFSYIELANEYGFKRLFTCLISLGRGDNEVLDKFKKIINYANSNDINVIADISPEVFRSLNIDYSDLGYLKDMGLYGLRLDLGFSGYEEAIMTHNKYDLKIELNMSGGTKYLDNIMCYDPKRDNLLGCHNFYPHRYTGLSYKHFIKCSKKFKKHNIRTAAFVSSETAKYGPWPVSEGLCTLEEHRKLSIDTQAKHLFATNLIDDIIIANAFASEEDFRALSLLDPYKIALKVKLEEGISDLEKKIVLKEHHYNRGDISDYMIRSTQSRVKYREYSIEPFNTRDIKKGDVLIDNSLYNRYAGELQIALKDMKNFGKTNVVGRIIEEEIFLLDYIRPMQNFSLIL